MIPKIIHYCWFGRGEMPKLIKKCIKRWYRFFEKLRYLPNRLARRIFGNNAVDSIKRKIKK